MERQRSCRVVERRASAFVGSRFPLKAIWLSVDQHGHAIDVYLSMRRDTLAARRFFIAAISADGESEEVVTDRAHTLNHVIGELLPAAFLKTAQDRHLRHATAFDEHFRLP